MEPEFEPQVPPLMVEDRATFILQRYTAYKEVLLEHCGHVPDGPRGDPLRARMRAIANDLALRDLQALLGRDGPAAYRIEVALLRIERGIAHRPTPDPPLPASP